MIAFEDQWPSAQYKGDYTAFLNSMTKAERLAWRQRTDRERQQSMAKGTTRGRPRKTETQASQLLEALTFIIIGTKDDEDYQQYVTLSNKMAIAFNGQICAGHPIIEEINLCPHLGKMKTALSKSGKTLLLAETPAKALSVKGDNLRAVVPCISAEDLPRPEPDANIAPLPEIIKDAFRVCGTLASEAGEKVYEASLLLEANTCTGTNGAAMLQFWHGINLPPKIVLPKLFTAGIAKIDKPIVGFGFSWLDQTMTKVGSFTIWFEGGAWVRTQCYQDEWPDVEPIFAFNTSPKPTPPNLFDAIEAVSHFTDDGGVIFDEGKIKSHDSEDAGAQYDVPGLVGGKTFNGKLMRQCGPFAASIDLTSAPDRAFFFGGEGQPVRGVIMGYSSRQQPTEQPAWNGQEPSGTIGGAQINGDDDEPSDEEINQGWGQS